jgi:methylenetetrahydrofolate dehydrogenase (NADP+)/methenyltetrahydrofolate cyclohydrolase
MLTLDGKKVRDFHMRRLVDKVKALSRTPTLALFQIGNNSASETYIRQKKAFADKIGARVIHRHFPNNVSFDEVASAIRADNADSTINGIILQLPVPRRLDGSALIELIDRRKDVDGLTEINQVLLSHGHVAAIPATAKAVLFILDFYGISVVGKRVVVLGRSRLVGKPTALLLSARGADVEVCHSQTPHPEAISLTADILVVAIGKPRLIGPKYIKQGAVVIDVGITEVDERLVGDVNQEAVAGMVSAMTPVPGGVGPVTVLSLFDTLVESAESVSLRH